MYQLQDSVLLIKGVGTNSQADLADNQIEKVIDLLLYLPLRYEDRSDIKTIAEIKNLAAADTQIQKSAQNQQVKTNFVTTQAKVVKFNEYRKGRLLISRATISDPTQQLNCLWFNNKFLKNKLIAGQEYFFSGNLKDSTLMQATVEKVTEESIHTGRLVPIYPQLADFKQGSLRRILAETITKLHQSGEAEQIFKDLHFPSDIDTIIKARERLALEEIIYLMQVSAQYKAIHQQKTNVYQLSKTANQQLPELPFTLTTAQEKAVQEIFQDLSQKVPMNRLLVGDVGSGKTIVAAIPASLLAKNDQNVCLIAPTKILAKQHYDNLSAIFKDIDFVLLDSQTKLQKITPGTFYVGTHALLNQLTKIKPSLVIYDEQQRFGVKHRQLDEYLTEQKKYPHLLSMTATPIPRTLMLSIFKHLDVSYLDQMPNSRKMATTWLVPQEKEVKALEWLTKELLDNNHHQKQALVVCPFINPSSYKATENVAAVKDSFDFISQTLEKIYQKLAIDQSKHLKIAMLHSKLSKQKQTEIIQEVYQQQIQILISTPMIEVGVDLPNADIMVIQSAERFGLSSLHQLRGRVGRQGQASYCLLFNSTNTVADPKSQIRLQKFCQEKDGLKLAQLDLENRGAGNILGYQQSGLHDLIFASWTNAKIIEQAQQKIKNSPNYQSFLTDYLQRKNTAEIVASISN